MQEHSRIDHLFATLNNQKAPPSLFGQGRRILYQCPQCRRPWLLDGTRSQYRLSPEELARVAQEVGADLAHLPFATCRFCLLEAGVGIFETDEYGCGKGGYGFNWEAADPVGAHLLATVLSCSWTACRSAQEIKEALTPQIVQAPRTARAVLRWLSETKTFPCIALIPREMSDQIAQGNPPGHGMAGTEHWQWKGAAFRMPCPPLQDEALVVLALALPPEEDLDLFGLIALWQDLAAYAAQGRFAGEDPAESVG